MAEERLTEDPLFLACTRPAMVMGVPMEAMGVNVIVSGVVFLVAAAVDAFLFDEECSRCCLAISTAITMHSISFTNRALPAPL